MASNKASDLTATCCMPDMERVAQVEVFSREVRNSMIHVVAGTGLVGPAVAAPVVDDHTISVMKEKHHLGIPVVR